MSDLKDRTAVWLWFNKRSVFIWAFVLTVSFGASAALVYTLDQGEDKTLFTSGAMSHGHYQIELACESCHQPFENDLQAACENCHSEELARIEDSHGEKKFRDPRNADLLDRIDAMKCVTCHSEHKPEITAKMAVTQPADFCVHCHADVAEDRPSHQDLPFEGCSQCHGYHDNKALYEDFLVKHLDAPDVLEPARTPERNLGTHYRAEGRHDSSPLSVEHQDAPPSLSKHDVTAEWAADIHSRSGVNCSHCHERDGEWTTETGVEQCRTCHEAETDGFIQGRHGMRHAVTLSAMKVGNSRLKMKRNAADRQLHCSSCHADHRFDTANAAIDACLECHDDKHSRAYRESPHYTLVQREIAGELATGSGVTCATCHLPRQASQSGRVFVDHNQNNSLRPNHKQIRPVCMQCHGLGFSLNALADTALIQRNFKGHPSVHLESLEMARKRAERNKN